MSAEPGTLDLGQFNDDAESLREAPHDTDPGPAAGETRYGWCMDGEHDTPGARGPCPIQVGALLACPCECHCGDTRPRGYLPVTAASSREG